MRECTGSRLLIVLDSGDEVTVQAGEEGALPVRLRQADRRPRRPIRPRVCPRAITTTLREQMNGFLSAIHQSQRKVFLCEMHKKTDLIPAIEPMPKITR